MAEQQQEISKLRAEVQTSNGQLATFASDLRKALTDIQTYQQAIEERRDTIYELLAEKETARASFWREMNGWRTAISNATGILYYYNIVTNESTYIRPNYFIEN